MGTFFPNKQMNVSLVKIGYNHLTIAPITDAEIARRIAGVVMCLGSSININGAVCLGDNTPTMVARVE